MRRNKSKKFAMAVALVTAMLTFYALNQHLESAAGLIFGSGIPSAMALYANKQHQDRKWAEIDKDKQDGNTN